MTYSVIFINSGIADNSTPTNRGRKIDAFFWTLIQTGSSNKWIWLLTFRNSSFVWFDGVKLVLLVDDLKQGGQDWSLQIQTLLSMLIFPQQE